MSIEKIKELRNRTKENSEEKEKIKKEIDAIALSQTSFKIGDHIKHKDYRAVFNNSFDKIISITGKLYKKRDNKVKVFLKTYYHNIEDYNAVKKQ